jgi:hypothetical protein
MYRSLAILLLPATALASDPTSKTDLAAIKASPGIDGTSWRLVATIENDIRKVHQGQETTYCFWYGQASVQTVNGNTTAAVIGPYSVDMGKVPHQITWGKLCHGRFQRTGDTLWLRTGAVGWPATTLDTKDGNPAPLVILRRIDVK